MASSNVKLAIEVDGEEAFVLDVFINAPGVQGDLSGAIRRLISEVLEPEEPRRSSLDELLRRRRPSSDVGVYSLNLDELFQGDVPDWLKETPEPEPEWLSKQMREFVRGETPPAEPEGPAAESPSDVP